jgi:TldD protein
LVSEKIAQKVLEAALETGGDFSELFLEDTESSNLSMIDGKLESATYKRIRGAGVRVLKGSLSAYAYTADLSEEALIKTARAAAAVFSSPKAYTSMPIAVKQDYTQAVKRHFKDIENAHRIDLLKRMHKAAKGYSEEISQVSSRYFDITRRIEIFNSEGLHVSDTQPRVRVMVEAVAMKDGEAQSGFEGPGLGMGFEAFDIIDVEATALQAAKTAVTMLHGKPCPAKTVPVVIDGGFGGVILHEACVHGLEATFVAKGDSVFAGKLGQKVASDIVTAVDDGTLPGEWGSIRIDDEGTPGKRNVLIENGILKSYLVDRRNAAKMNHHLTGSSRRQDYTFAPTSRMTNTFFAPGDDDEEEMIRSIDEGLFAARMGGGSVMPLTGDFNFAVAEGYWIKNGEIVCPVRGATLIGRGADVLFKIDRIGKKLWLGQGNCGSLSGMVPTNVGQPRIRVSEMVVGGKGGDI